jgi:hypothetical protein
MAELNYTRVSLGYNDDNIEDEMRRLVVDSFMAGTLTTNGQPGDLHAWRLNGRPLPNAWRDYIDQLTEHDLNALTFAADLPGLDRDLDDGSEL